MQLLLTDQLFLVHGRHHELCVVNRAITVDVYSIKHVVDMFIGQGDVEVIFVSLLYLLLVQRSISVIVNQFKDLLQIFLLLLSGQMRSDKGHCRLLYLLMPLEGLEVLDRARSDFCSHPINV